MGSLPSDVRRPQALRLLSTEEVRALEPEVRCAGALLSPSTGVVDSHGLMLALQGEAEAKGASVALRTSLLGARATPEGFVIRTATRDHGHAHGRAHGHTGDDGSGANGTDGALELLASELINCAGLSAPRLARCIGGMDAERVPSAFFAKGNYYALQAPPLPRVRMPCMHILL